MEKEPKDYEIGFLAEDETGAGKVLQTLTAHGAEILLEGSVERVVLAYSILHRTAAHFGYFHFRIAPEGAELLKKALKAPAGIMRFLIITPPFAKPKPRWENRARRTTTAAPVTTQSAEAPAPLPLSNEALEKKIEEILK